MYSSIKYNTFEKVYLGAPPSPLQYRLCKIRTRNLLHFELSSVASSRTKDGGGSSFHARSTALSHDDTLTFHSAFSMTFQMHFLPHLFFFFYDPWKRSRYTRANPSKHVKTQHFHVFFLIFLSSSEMYLDRFLTSLPNLNKCITGRNDYVVRDST